MKDEAPSEGFKVSDRRHFREDGELRADAQPSSKPEQPGSIPGMAGEPPPGEMRKIDFPSYVLSYYTQGLVLLGEVPNPITNKRDEDIESAKHMIDILGMLQEKTKGNLTKEEDQLLDSVLYELRLKFMAKTNRIKL